MDRDVANEIYQAYNLIIRTLVGMINHPETWVVSSDDRSVHEEPEQYGASF